MAPPKIDQGVVIILDVGKNVSTPEEKGGKSFFENARECASKVIERKIMSQAKNYVGVILLGSKKTKNSMAEQCKGAFKHVELFMELDAPTWNMIRELPEKPSEKCGDWVDALIVAAEHLKNQTDVKIINKKIILMTNFQSPTANDPSDVKIVLQGFKEECYEVDVIGPDIYDNKFKGDDIELAREFVEATNGATETFDFTLRYLLFHKKKAVNPMPWNVDLSIGPNIKIPVTAYIRIKDEAAVKPWRKAVKDPITNSASTTEGIMRTKMHFNTENQSVVETPEVIKGYPYGQKIIPLTEFDQTLLYESGERCLSVYGFTDANNINWQSLNGDGLSYVFGRKGDKKAIQAVKCLVECLHELKLVGIVRRVYNRNNAPKMYALFPVIDNDGFICLSLVALCFKDDIKYMSFPSTNLKRFNCSEEQVNAFKDLIKAMDLTRAYDEKTFDDTEAFPIAQTFSPYAQYVLDCITYRALNPDKPLPQPRDDIMNLFKVPPLVEQRSREHIEKLKSLFVLNKVEKKEKKKKISVLDDDSFVKPQDVQETNGSVHNDMPKITLPVKTDKIDRIGTLDPVGDFDKLKNMEKPLSELTADMASAIENLIYCNLDGNFSKAFAAMLHLRKECVEKDPSLYNDWLKRFKVALNDRNKQDIINLISEKNLSFILKSENSSSTYDNEDSHNDTQLYENDTIPNSAQLTIQSEINDIFDEF